MCAILHSQTRTRKYTVLVNPQIVKADGVSGSRLPRFLRFRATLFAWLTIHKQTGPEAELRRRSLRLEDDGREARRPAREDPMSRSRLVSFEDVET